MQVILLERIEKLGQIGEVVTVKNGFARNFLLPRKKALRATKDNLEVFEARRAELEKQHEERRANAEKLAEVVAGLAVTIVRQAGDDGRLFGSVSTKDVAQAITEKASVTISHEQVVFDHKFKEIGTYEIELHLHADIKAKVSLIISRGENHKTA